MKYYIDTETCGFCGPIVLLQYAIDEGPIVLINVWKKKVSSLIALYELIAQNEVIGFNLAFDIFKICQQYTTLLLIEDKEQILEDVIQEYAEKESIARDGPCWKARELCDVMLVARKTVYQSTMERKPIRIKRVPTPLALQLKNELQKRIILPDILFARKKTPGDQWTIKDTNKPEFKDLVLNFAPSSGLKALAVDALKKDKLKVQFFADIEIDVKLEEFEYAPFYPFSNWPNVIKGLIEQWRSNEKAREYARDDVDYTRSLYHYFNDPAPGDDDSELTGLVAAVRWHGFEIDIPKLENLQTKMKHLVGDVGVFNPNNVPTAPKQAAAYLAEALEAEEKIVYEIAPSTKRGVLEDFSKRKIEGTERDHPVAIRAKAILEKRMAKYDLDIYNKLLSAKRFHAAFKVTGALSGRMAGGTGSKKTKNINPQGIKHTKNVRSSFTLAPPGMILGIGDFDAFEVSIADAVFNDAELRRALTHCWKCDYEYKPSEFLDDYCPGCKGKDSRTKIHALFAMELFPGTSYEDILKSKGTGNDLYDKGKRAVFALIYGGNWVTLKQKIGIDLAIGERAFNSFINKYKGVFKAKKENERRFCSMRQEGGIGSKVIWSDPDEYVESLFGFRRYFTLENKICKTLFELANKPPKGWQDIKIKVVRRDRVQTVSGATQSALYAGAFAVQAACLRAAENHRIQSSGATITKRLQRNIWELQPSGVHPFQVLPANIHDEVICPMLPELKEKVESIVNETVESFRKDVPLISMKWKSGAKNWGEK